MIFKTISSADIKTTRTNLNQLVDFVEEDISGSATRRSYQMFVTGGIGPGVTSSLYQTVYDQDFSLQTSNPMFDITVGIFSGSSSVSPASLIEFLASNNIKSASAALPVLDPSIMD